MVKTAVFASGNGSNFENIVAKLKEGSASGFEVSLLIADKENAYVLERAKNHNIESLFINPKLYSSKKEFEEKIIEELERRDIDFIILAGYMRIISDVLLNKYDRKIINIHPAYLPEFPGKDGIGDAFNAKVDKTGVTIHYVDSGIDTGEIIYQERIDIDKSWDKERLEKEVHKVEHRIYPKVLTNLFRGEEK